MTAKKSASAGRKKKIAASDDLRRIVIDGYQKLALGPVGDAVRLMMIENVDSLDFDRLDLINLAEVKRAKGVIELKFFDRLAALDRLAQIAKDAETQGLDRFCAALSHGAMELYRDREPFDRKDGDDDDTRR